jgi:hypothetical protein
MYACNVDIYVLICECQCACVWGVVYVTVVVCPYIHTHTYIQRYIHTNIHTHMHTGRHRNLLLWMKRENSTCLTTLIYSSLKQQGESTHVCMYAVYVYVCMWILRVSLPTFIQVWSNRVRLHMYVCMQYMCVYVCMYVCVWVHIYIHTWIHKYHAYIYIYIYIYIYTHTEIDSWHRTKWLSKLNIHDIHTCVRIYINIYVCTLTHMYAGFMIRTKMDPTLRVQNYTYITYIHAYTHT